MADKLKQVDRLRKARARGEFANSARKEQEEILDPTEGLYQQIVKQVEAEYMMGWRFMKPKIQEWLLRLTLYNNQKRDKNRVGLPVIFTYFQSIHAALYDDKLAVEFGGREEGDEEMAQNLNYLSEFDYNEMDMPFINYEWIWDSLAWGRSLLYFNEFDLSSKTPIPEVWDPLTFIRDPKAKSVNGNRLRRDGLRFGYREVKVTKGELEGNPEYFNLNKLKTESGKTLSLAFEARQARSQAQGTENVTALQNLEDNQEFTVLQGFTILNGKKYLIELGNERKLLIRMTPIEGDMWPLIDRPIYPISHDWDGVSVFDILEDKQRYQAVLLNLIGDMAQSDAHPMYIFNENKIKRSIDKSFAQNKWIPADGDIQGAAAPLQKAQPSPIVSFVLDFLDISNQKALAVPELRQGIPTKQDRTLGELELVSSGVDTRYSLSAKVFGWSEYKFWQRWYEIYDRDFQSGIHRKVTRLTSTFGPTWRPITRDKIITSNPLGPDIKIQSKTVSEAKKRRDFQLFANYIAQNAQNPGFDLTYAQRKQGGLFLPKDEVERMWPLSPDELEAKEVVKRINEGEFIPVNPAENHIVHLRMLASAKDGPAKEARQQALVAMMIARRSRPDLFAPLPEEQPGRFNEPQGQMTQGRPNESMTASNAQATAR